MVAVNFSKMKQILLIDPEKTSLRLTKKFLENHGYEVTACESAGAALDVLLDPKYDLIVSEIDIKGLDGFDLGLILSKYQIEIPLIFLTSRDDEATRNEALYAGVIDFVSKQTEYTLLPKKVGEVLQKKSYLAS